jgi:hypothetical protein
MDEFPEQVPEERIDQAERHQDADHSHQGVSPQDDTLGDHLEDAHQLDAPDSLSTGTEKGLHDRLHGKRHAEEH